MKTKKFTKKLAINKNTVAHLDNSDMDNAKGGYVKTTIQWCISRRFCSEYPFNCETRYDCSIPYCETDPYLCM